MDILKREAIWFLGTLLCAGCAAESARERLERSLDAMGIPALAEPEEGLSFDASGTLNQGVERQGRSPGSLDPTAFRESLAVAVAKGRLAYEYRHERYDGSEEWIRDLYQNDERTIVVRSEGFAVRLQSPDYVTERKSLWRRFPHLLLREGLAAPDRVKLTGGEAVALELETGETLLLGLDPETSLLSRVDFLTDLQTFGDTDVSWRFEDYRPVDGFGLLPHRYRVTVSGRPFIEMEVERATADHAVWSDFFTLPDHMERPEMRTLPGGDAAARARVETVAPGIHIVQNLRLGFHPMFIELDDAVVALDAPAGYRLLTQLPAGDVAPGPSSAWLSERFIELIEETVPDKPIRYVVLTHFHNDHAGGLRAFVAKGAAIVGPAAIREAVEKLVTAAHTVAPDGLAAAAPRELRFEAVEGSRRLGRIELLEVGPNPHTDSMLAVRIPEEQIFFSSDLMELRPFFPDWLQARALAPERLYSMHAAGPVSIEQLKEHR